MFLICVSGVLDVSVECLICASAVSDVSVECLICVNQVSVEYKICVKL